MTNHPLSPGVGVDPEEHRELDALGLRVRNLTGCPDPALVLALDESVLDDAVAARVREHVVACPACQSAAADLARVFDEDPTAESRRRIDARIAAARPQRSKRLWFWLVPAGGLAVAATAIFLMLSSEHSVPPVPDAFEARSATTLPSVLVVDRPAIPRGEIDLAVRGDATRPADVDNQAALALDRADAGDLAGAVTDVVGLAAKHPDSRLALLAAGALELKDNRNADALAALDRARALTSHPDKTDEINWFLAIARVRTGDRPGAKQLLEALCHGGSARKTLACAGIAELDRSPSR